jgi:hypothetical protein
MQGLDLCTLQENARMARKNCHSITSEICHNKTVSVLDFEEKLS